MIAPPPPGERTHQETQTPQANTGSSANTQPQPPTEQTRPQQASASTPPSEHKERAHTNTCGHTKCERRRTRVLAEATGQNEAQTHDAGTQDNAHNKARKQRGLRTVCACARKGRTAREKAGHA